MKRQWLISSVCTIAYIHVEELLSYDTLEKMMTVARAVAIEGSHDLLGLDEHKRKLPESLC